jgi:hypothetical protein
MRLITLLGLLLPAVALADPRSELLDATLAGAPPEQHESIRFLVAHMPERDVAALKPDFLRENIALAHRARAEFPWAAEVPDAIFLNDVVPYATLDESRDDWRAEFLECFRAHVTGADGFRDAVMRVNAVVLKETGVDYSTRRRAANQGPRESMELKVASCTGLSILLVNALRSVGLPARIAGTAMWTTKRGNHNWVEVWLPDTGTWHFTEFHLDGKGLDHGWLLADAARGIPGSRLHGVFATSWKPTGKHFPLVWNMADTSVPGIDVTQRYIDLGKDSLPAVGECELRIEALDANGVRLPLKASVRQADVLVASGTTPGTTDDTNRFFTATVKQGQLYQVVITGEGPRPLAVEQLEIKNGEETRRVTLKLSAP